MGLVYMGIHQPIALKLRDELNLRVFIETGTYMGDTVRWAMDKFDKVISMDISEAFIHKVSRIIHSPNVSLLQGDSRTLLAKVCQEKKDEPTLFWLDAHWTGEAEYHDPLGHCPLLEEVEAINKNFSGVHAIMVDDYTLWARPLMNELYILLRDALHNDRKVAVLDDVIIACKPMPSEYLVRLI